MATEPKRDPIKRVAVLVEFESGATGAIYAQPDPHHNDAAVIVNLDRPVDERPDLYAPGDGRAGRRYVESSEASVLVRGLHEFQSIENMPAMIGAVLDSVRNAVNL